MKNLNNMALLSIFAVFSAQACVVTVFNDTDQSYRLHLTNNAQNQGVLEPKQKIDFGNKTTKADFVVAERQNGNWVNMLHVYQEKCGMTDEEEAEKKDKSLNLSEIIADNLNAEYKNLFVIETFDAMQESPAPVKKSSCGCKG